MGLSEILTLLLGLLQFPQTLLEFVKLLSKAPAEKHDEILKAISDQSKKFEDTGRPTWD
jgi:hypothetical protein